jgi:hypothetical protein
LKRCRYVGPEALPMLVEYHKENTVVDEFNENFQIRLHKELKKLILDFFPQIPEASSTCIREIDYLLYAYTLKISEKIQNILEEYR